MKKYYFILSFCLLSNIYTIAQDCDGVNINQTTNISSNDVIAAEQTLIATNQITGSANVTYQAVNYVLLKGDFFVNGSSSLLAKTATCIPVMTTEDIAIIGLQVTIANNPTNSELSFEYQIIESTELEITLLDLYGRTIESIQPLSRVSTGTYTHSLDLSDFAQGSYFLHFQTNEGRIHVSKLIKI